MFKKILLVFCLFILSSKSYGEVIKVFEFTESELSNLEEKKVRGAKNKTIFSVGINENGNFLKAVSSNCLLYTSPSPRDATLSRMPSSA